MAITDVEAFAHLSPDEIAGLGAELDALRAEVVADRGTRDHDYVHRVIAFQRGLDLGSRLAMALGVRNRTLWALGVGGLAMAKIVENMELGHNVMHGQWDWMNDPEIHSTTWEWDLVGASEHWKRTHNYHHHKFTNIVGMDDDLGYGVLRVTRDEPWQPRHLANIPVNAFLMALFEWGIGLQDVQLGAALPWTRFDPVQRKDARTFLAKAGRQILKDYALFPLLAGPAAARVATGTLAANFVRNLWTNAVIFCGHFPDGAEKFQPDQLEDEDPAHWYLRQLLGSANISGGPIMDFLTGNLSYQVEHHMFPDLPSNRYAEMAARVRDLCERYDLPYVTGPLWKQYAQSWRTIAKLSLPDAWLRHTPDDAPETRSEHLFDGDPEIHGLRTALAAHEERLPA